MADTKSILDAIAPQLHRPQEDPRPIVVMMCGLSGAGKSSLSHAIISTHPQFTRLSVDGIVYETHGLYKIDYEPHLYDQYLDEAQPIYQARLEDLLARGKDVVLDRSFYAREDRDAFREVVEAGGGRLFLVYLRCSSKEGLWRRIEGRVAKRGTLGGVREGDAAFDVTKDVLDRYWEGFEGPEGEGEVVFDVV